MKTIREICEKELKKFKDKEFTQEVDDKIYEIAQEHKIIKTLSELAGFIIDNRDIIYPYGYLHLSPDIYKIINDFVEDVIYFELKEKIQKKIKGER